jgi:hypothetical protein
MNMIWPLAEWTNSMLSESITRMGEDVILLSSCKKTQKPVNIQHICILSVYADHQFQAGKAGFEEGMASAEESQQIYDELEKIDQGLAKIGETLRESKEFWEGVDRKLSSTPASQQMKDPPDGITAGPEVSHLLS